MGVGVLDHLQPPLATPLPNWHHSHLQSNVDRGQELRKFHTKVKIILVFSISLGFHLYHYIPGQNITYILMMLFEKSAKSI